MTTVKAAASRVDGTRQGDVLVAQLDALRHRARRVLAIRYCVVAAVPAVVAGQAVAAATDAGPVHTLTILSLSLAASLGLAVALAVRRAPTLSGTAAIVDRRQRLESRVATGLQFAADDDPVSLLVTSDAAARLSTCDPATVFPLELPRRWPWMLGGAAIASLIVALGSAGTAPGQRASGAGGGATAGPAQGRSTNASSPAGTSPRPSTAPAERPAPEAAVTRPMDPSREMPPTGRDTSSAPPRSSDQKGTASTSSGSTSSSTIGDRAPGDRSAGTNASSAGAAASGAPSSGTTAGPGSARTGAGGAGAGTARRLASGAGGVKGGALTSPGLDSPLAATAPLMTPGSARYRAEWKRGQAAIARERVPPALRKYVRDYFTAIRPRQP